MPWLDIWFGISNNCGVWLNGVEQNNENDVEHDEDCDEEGFRLAGVKFDRDDEGGK